MATQMASTRQPFAQLNGARLQTLTSLKNRQNATLSPPSKRKAQAFDSDNNENSENIDPISFLSPKRSKCPDGSSKDRDTLHKPTNYFLTRAPTSPNDFTSFQKPIITSPRRDILSARSPAAPRLNTTTKSLPLSAPAGRSPTRKRIGILNRRRTSSNFTRVDPPRFGASSTSTGLGFSIDAALSGTIPSYTPRPQVQAPQTQPQAADLGPDLSAIPLLHTPVAKESWFFAIHEDTEEELATNLMEHSTCTLDISSDEESRDRMRDERGKENVAPSDDVSQTRSGVSSSSRSSVESVEMGMGEIKARVKAERRRAMEGEIEVDRSPLGDLAAKDFYAEGVEEGDCFLVHDADAEEDAETATAESKAVPEVELTPLASTFDFVSELKGKGKEIDPSDLGIPSFDIDTLMMKGGEAVGAKLLEPIEKAEEGFSVWESGSAKGDE